ncbi:MAG: hypothetical protein J7M08_02195 [Planctomycetes bacterium]|nr:hypothetical protein [Planctomycetota bacterium]
MSKRLVINLDVCRDCGECTAECSYPYHPDNDGVSYLREVAAQELICRQCEVRSCVEACPNEALEAREDGTIRRYNMRCTGCLSCSLGCPFGVIIPAALQFKDSRCDFCVGRQQDNPLCAQTCPHGAITVEEVSEEEADLHILSDKLAVRARAWQKLESARET